MITATIKQFIVKELLKNYLKLVIKYILSEKHRNGYLKIPL